MTRQFWMIAVVTAVFLFSCNRTDDSFILPQENAMDQTAAQIIPGQYIVVYNTNVIGNAGRLYKGNIEMANQFVIDKAREILSANKISHFEIKNVFSQTINGAVVNIAENELAKLKTDKRIAYIEQDRIVSFRPPWERNPDDGGGDTNSGEEIPWGITRVNGGETYIGNNVAWILDSGIDLDHEDLNVDASRGFNAFVSGRDSKSLDDGDGHGTHVAGTIAAIDNEVGVVGVAAGATVIPVKVLDSRGSGSYSGVIAGVDHVGANGSSGDVANMSLGGPVSQALDDAVLAASQKGIKFIIAAGNSGANANNYSPARVNGSNIFTISAMGEGDTWASFSNFANPPIDYCAPGVSIKSTWKGGAYNTISGTSMAAPHAAGVLLLGNPATSGNVIGDPDGNADPIIFN